jgi:beta-N-acetylhexosaminidase
MKITLTLFALLLSATTFFTALSCQTGPPELEQPDIRGTVEGLSDSMSSSDISGFILIEGALEEDTKYDRALVTVRSSTRIYQQNGERLVKARYAHIRQSSVLEVWFTGPVAESYPVQADAGTIVILK